MLATTTTAAETSRETKRVVVMVPGPGWRDACSAPGASDRWGWGCDMGLLVLGDPSWRTSWSSAPRCRNVHRLVALWSSAVYFERHRPQADRSTGDQASAGSTSMAPAEAVAKAGSRSTKAASTKANAMMPAPTAKAVVEPCT
jgi:hypothetical protein